MIRNIYRGKDGHPFFVSEKFGGTACHTCTESAIGGGLTAETYGSYTKATNVSTGTYDRYVEVVTPTGYGTG